MDVWRRHGRDVRGHALPGRHYIAEECPDETFEALRAFFSAE
jgi:haloacetate dehalogenase